MARTSYVQLGFRIPVEVDDELRRMAFSQNVSKSAFVTNVIVKWLEEYKAKKDKEIKGKVKPE
jgi:hypothetical protein